MELFWDAFEAAPSLAAYRRLLDEAAEDAPDVKTRAVETLTHRVGQQPHDAARTPALAGALVEILAYEGETDRAWQVATVHGCDRQMWLTLARGREDTHPLEAIGVYEPEVFAQVDAKKNHTYRQAVACWPASAGSPTTLAGRNGSRTCSGRSGPSTAAGAT